MHKSKPASAGGSLARHKVEAQSDSPECCARLKQNKWNLLYLVLAALIAFSLFAVPQIAIGYMNRTKGNIITVLPE